VDGGRIRGQRQFDGGKGYGSQRRILMGSCAHGHGEEQLRLHGGGWDGQVMRLIVKERWRRRDRDMSARPWVRRLGLGGTGSAAPRGIFATTLSDTWCSVK
jgi:hypothetical protein